MVTIKALSLWQPWSSLMAIGAKKIETRSWSTPYRGLIAIHAAKRFQEMERLLLGQTRFFNALTADREPGDVIATAELADSLPLGCFVAVGRLNHCISTTHGAMFIPPKTDDEFWFGDYSEDRFMWVFNEIWKLSAPVYSRGQQGLWTLEEGVKDVIVAMLPEEVRESEFGE